MCLLQGLSACYGRHMYTRLTRSGGRTYLQIVEAFRCDAQGRARAGVAMVLGQVQHATVARDLQVQWHAGGEAVFPVDPAPTGRCTIVEHSPPQCMQALSFPSTGVFRRRRSWTRSWATEAAQPLQPVFQLRFSGHLAQISARVLATVWVSSR